jgi:hypothetical protein
MTKAEITTRLEQAAQGLIASALHYRETSPPDADVLCTALVLQHSGRSVLVGISDPRARLAALQAFTRETGDVAGFALVFDGYVSVRCVHCDGAGCPKCADATWTKPRVDAIIAVVRTAWGEGSTKSVAYAFKDGAFALLPDRNEDTAQHPTVPVLDNYDMVFRDVAVH